MQVHNCACKETDKGDSIRNHFHGLSRGSQGRTSNPLSAVSIYDQSECQIRTLDHTHAEVNGFLIVFGILHFGHDWNEVGSTC